MVEKGSKRGTYRFAVNPEKLGLAPGDRGGVELAGDFNGWQPQRMRKNNKGQCVAVVSLEPGTYEYKFLAGGQWHVDPDHSDWAANQFGTLNSVMTVA